METNSPKQKPVQSSLITAYVYDNQSYQLTVTFKDGAEWSYKGVTPDVLSQVFDSPKSIGSKFIRLIKNGKYSATKQ